MRLFNTSRVKKALNEALIRVFVERIHQPQGGRFVQAHDTTPLELFSILDRYPG